MPRRFCESGASQNFCLATHTFGKSVHKLLVLCPFVVYCTDRGELRSATPVPRAESARRPGSHHLLTDRYGHPRPRPTPGKTRQKVIAMVTDPVKMSLVPRNRRGFCTPPKTGGGGA